MQSLSKGPILNYFRSFKVGSTLSSIIYNRYSNYEKIKAYNISKINSNFNMHFLVTRLVTLSIQLFSSTIRLSLSYIAKVNLSNIFKNEHDLSKIKNFII